MAFLFSFLTLLVAVDCSVWFIAFRRSRRKNPNGPWAFLDANIAVIFTNCALTFGNLVWLVLIKVTQ